MYNIHATIFAVYNVSNVSSGSHDNMFYMILLNHTIIQYYTIGKIWTLWGWPTTLTLDSDLGYQYRGYIMIRYCEVLVITQDVIYNFIIVVRLPPFGIH